MGEDGLLTTHGDRRKIAIPELHYLAVNLSSALDLVSGSGGSGWWLGGVEMSGTALR